ncbi:MAG: type II secretion system protein [Planctomycetes bacterium]|nr:type II secretion system protein [Planctomycetota bacterium]
MQRGPNPRGEGRGVGPDSARGFSLLELIIVLAVTVVLTGLMLPTLAQVRENVNRVLCSSNMRQLGLGMTMYYRDNRDRLPHAETLAGAEPDPGELMAAHQGYGEEEKWDGLGRLYSEGYCTAPDCYYCPSHRGQHNLEDKRVHWQIRNRWSPPLYTNYQYAGDVYWGQEAKGRTPRRLRQLKDGERLVLATDGWRRLSDFNHSTGMNVLRGDGSVRWFEDSEADPLASHIPGEGGGGGYYRIWELLNK